MSVVLEGSALTVQRGGRTLLRGVSLALERGEVMVLVGPNGAGKSTLLSVLAGDMAPTAGTVTLAGRPIQRMSPRERARWRSVLLQSNEVSFPFTVAQVVEMGRSPWRGHARERDDAAAIAAAVADADLAALAARRTSELSGGEKARVALARVLAQATPVLVLDEPTAALDIRHQERVLRRARAHALAGGAALIVLHDLDLAAAYADRIAVLHDGVLRSCAAPDRALRAELLTEVYGHRVRVLTDRGGNAPIVVPDRQDPLLPLAAEVAAAVGPSGAQKEVLR